MIRFCLDRHLIGTKEHLVANDGSFYWAKRLPQNTWHLSGKFKEDSDWCLDTVLHLGGCLPRLLPPESFVKQMTLLMGNKTIPWQLVMSKKAHVSFVKKLSDDVTVAMATAPLNYYRTVWVAGNGIFKALQPCKVDTTLWQQTVNSGEGNVAATRSFQPQENEMTRDIVYDRFRTLTGRLTVKSGPQILTLKKKHRNIMRSVFGNEGSIVALDFAALEPRILLYEHGRRCEETDLYGTIAKEMGQDRNAVKAAVLSLLYGSSKWALGKRLGILGDDLNTFVKNTQAYFNTDELLSRIKTQFIATGKIVGRHGRPIEVDEPLDHIFIAYYGQMTGVDVTMLGFGQIINQLAKDAPRIRPLFLLHDACLLDVHHDDMPKVSAITHIKIPGYVQKFPLRLEFISK